MAAAPTPLPAGVEAARAVARVSVRAMTPADVDACLQIHGAVFATAESAPFGESYARRFLQWFAVDEVPIALAAVDGDRIVGFVVGDVRRRLPWMYRRLVPIVARTVLVNPALLGEGRVRAMLRARAAFMLGGRAWDGRRPAPVPTMVLHTIAVLPEAQGTGAGGALVAAFEREARRRGARSMRLTVLSDNDRARRMYERAGWKAAAVLGPRTLYVNDLA